MPGIINGAPFAAPIICFLFASWIYGDRIGDRSHVFDDTGTTTDTQYENEQKEKTEKSCVNSTE